MDRGNSSKLMSILALAVSVLSLVVSFFGLNLQREAYERQDALALVARVDADQGQVRFELADATDRLVNFTACYPISINLECQENSDGSVSLMLEEVSRRVHFVSPDCQNLICGEFIRIPIVVRGSYVSNNREYHFQQVFFARYGVNVSEGRIVSFHTISVRYHEDVTLRRASFEIADDLFPRELRAAEAELRSR